MDGSTEEQTENKAMTGEHNTHQSRQDMRTGVILETKQRTSTSGTVQDCKQHPSPFPNSPHLPTPPIMLDSPMLMFENGAMAIGWGHLRYIHARARVNVYVYVRIPSPAHMCACEMCVHSRRAATRTRVSIKVRSTPQDLDQS